MSTQSALLCLEQMRKTVDFTILKVAYFEISSHPPWTTRALSPRATVECVFIVVTELPTLVTLESDHCRACSYWYPGCLQDRNLDRKDIILDVTSTNIVVLPLIYLCRIHAPSLGAALGLHGREIRTAAGTSGRTQQLAGRKPGPSSLLVASRSSCAGSHPRCSLGGCTTMMMTRAPCPGRRERGETRRRRGCRLGDG